jgi:hypothetical protein
LPFAHCPSPFVYFTYSPFRSRNIVKKQYGQICRTNRKSVRSLLYKFLAVPLECQTPACQTQFCILDQTLPRPDNNLMILTHLGKFRNHAVKQPTVVSFQIHNIHVHLISLLLYKHLFRLQRLHIASCFRPNVESVTRRSEVLMQK